MCSAFRRYLSRSSRGPDRALCQSEQCAGMSGRAAGVRCAAAARHATDVQGQRRACLGKSEPRFRGHWQGRTSLPPQPHPLRWGSAVRPCEAPASGVAAAEVGGSGKEPGPPLGEQMPNAWPSSNTPAPIHPSKMEDRFPHGSRRASGHHPKKIAYCKAVFECVRANRMALSARE